MFAENCPAHPAVPGLKAVTVHFLPPNTTAVLQPMDQSDIQCFKVSSASWYKKLLLRKMVKELDSNTDFKVDVLQAMHLAATALDRVSGTCVAN